MSKPRVIYWFRTDLRLHDSPALQAALDLSPEHLYPIWTWDPHYVYRARVGPNRWQFLIDCQNDLSHSITKLNAKSKLFLIREAPQTLFQKLFQAWKITHLVFEKDTDAYARERDAQVMRLAEESGVQVVVRTGRTLYDPDELVEKNGGRPTMSLTQVLHAAEKLGKVPRPIPPPTSLPDPGDTTLPFLQDPPSAEIYLPDRNASHRDGPDRSYTVGIAGPNGDFSIPTLSELGIKPATTCHRGGETVALKQLDIILSDTKYTAEFSKPATAPTAFSPQSTTLLSPHLHFGSVSCRLFYWSVQDIVDAYKARRKKHSVPPTSLTGQLLFRDMYFGAQAKLGYPFAQTNHNPNCRFIPWHLQSTYSAETGLATGSYTINSAVAEAWFQRWKHGRTGFPFIDALMRQLQQEGWIHHLGRHAVACFLTRGGCYVDWMRGADVFEEWLIDHEVACNIGNWQWLSCTAFFSQYHRVYSPTAFPAKWDKTGAFVRRYVPELAAFPERYIYEPWRCPIVDQKKAGCLVRRDDAGEEYYRDGLKTYPRPMFDFNQRRKICLASMIRAYKVGLYGDDSRVKDGSWRALFEDDDGTVGGGGGGGGGGDGGDADFKRGVEAGIGADVDEGVDEDGREAEEMGEGDLRRPERGDSKRKRENKKQGTLDGIVKKLKS